NPYASLPCSYVRMSFSVAAHASVISVSVVFFLTFPPPPSSTLFPYTTLFRSVSTELFVRVNAFSRDLDFSDSAKGEQQLYEVPGWLFRGLLDDVANGVGNRRLKHYALGLETS